MLGATVWLVQQWVVGTRFALLGKPDSANPKNRGPLILAGPVGWVFGAGPSRLDFPELHPGY